MGKEDFGVGNLLKQFIWILLSLYQNMFNNKCRDFFPFSCLQSVTRREWEGSRSKCSSEGEGAHRICSGRRQTEGRTEKGKKEQRQVRRCFL